MYYGLGIEVVMLLLAICHNWISCGSVELSRGFCCLFVSGVIFVEFFSCSQVLLLVSAADTKINSAGIFVEISSHCN